MNEQTMKYLYVGMFFTYVVLLYLMLSETLHIGEHHERLERIEKHLNYEYKQHIDELKKENKTERLDYIQYLYKNTK